MVDNPEELTQIEMYRDPDSGKLIGRDPETGDTFPVPFDEISVSGSYNTNDNHQFLGGSIQMPVLPDYDGSEHSVWWEDGTGNRDEGLYTEINGAVVKFVTE